MDLVRNIPLEERDRWCQELAEDMGTGAGVVGRGSKSVERETSLRVDSGVGSQDGAVEQYLWIANVADAVERALAGREEDDAGSNRIDELASRPALKKNFRHRKQWPSEGRTRDGYSAVVVLGIGKEPFT